MANIHSDAKVITRALTTGMAWIPLALAAGVAAMTPGALTGLPAYFKMEGVLSTAVVGFGAALLIGLLVASSYFLVAGFRTSYRTGVIIALKQYAKCLPEKDAVAVHKKLSGATTSTLGDLMVQAGYKQGYSALAGRTVATGRPFVPTSMKDINGHTYDSRSATMTSMLAIGAGAAAATAAGAALAHDDDMFGHNHHDFKPMVNVDGTPMMGDVDINGNPFGVTTDHDIGGDDFGSGSGGFGGDDFNNF